MQPFKSEHINFFQLRVPTLCSNTQHYFGCLHWKIIEDNIKDAPYLSWFSQVVKNPSWNYIWNSIYQHYTDRLFLTFVDATHRTVSKELFKISRNLRRYTQQNDARCWSFLIPRKAAGTSNINSEQFKLVPSGKARVICSNYRRRQTRCARLEQELNTKCLQRLRTKPHFRRLCIQQWKTNMMQDGCADNSVSNPRIHPPTRPLLLIHISA